MSADPDWNCKAKTFGGYLKDIKGRKVRFYRDSPKKRKRLVRIEVTSFCSIGSVGAKHLYVKLEEDFDSLWNREERRWQNCWDDSDGHGRMIEDGRQFLYGKDEDRAAKWISEQLQKHFPPQTHKHEFTHDRLSRKLQKTVGRISREGD